MFKCNICNKEILERERCNPEPLLPFEESVCHDCDSYVSAARMNLSYFTDADSRKAVASIIIDTLKMAHALKNSRKQFLEKMEEE